jgi:hypothetical protein
MTYEQLAIRLEEPTLERDSVFLLISKMIELKTGVPAEFTSEDSLKVNWPDGANSAINLANMWVECLQAPDERRSIIERFLRIVVNQQIDDERIDIQNILPLVREATWIEYLGDEREGVTEHLAGDLWVAYGIDRPESTAILRRTDAQKLRLEANELRHLALDNLARLLPDANIWQHDEWIEISANDSVYSCGLLLLDSFWDELETRVRGDLVVVVPTRDILLVTGSASSAGITAIRAEADSIIDNSHHVVSNTLLRRTNGQWVVYS